MGSWWVKSKDEGSSDIIGKDKNEKSPGKKDKKSLVSAQGESSKATRIDSLDMAPGEEELYSKSVNLNHFDIVKVIGRGSFGKVYLVKK